MYLYAGHKSYRHRMTAASIAGRPEDARAQLRDFVLALHQAYLDAARLLAPGERAALPLLAAEQVTVVVAAARHLHVIATTDRLPAPRGQEVLQTDELDDLRWSVRFYDPVVLPELGLIGEPEGPDPAQVRRVLGIGAVLYHLSVAPGGGLSAHHALHTGTGLANEHAALVRDGESLRALFRCREDLVGEFVIAERHGLHHSLRLLAGALAGDDPGVTAAVARADDAAVRRSVLAAARLARLARP